MSLGLFEEEQKRLSWSSAPGLRHKSSESRAPGRSDRLGGGSWAARLGVGGLGQLTKAVSRVMGGGQVTAAQQNRVRVLEAGHKFKTVGKRKSKNQLEKTRMEMQGELEQIYQRHETGIKYRHVLYRKSLFLAGKMSSCAFLLISRKHAALMTASTFSCDEKATEDIPPQKHLLHNQGRDDIQIQQNRRTGQCWGERTKQRPSDRL